VSIGSNGLDYLRVTFKDTSLFIDKETGLSFDKNTAFYVKIPKQMDTQHAQTLKVLLKIFEISLIVFLVVSLFLLLCLTDSAKTLWSAVHAFQVWAYFYVF